MTTRLAGLTKKVETLPPELKNEITNQIFEDIGNEPRRRETLAQSQRESLKN